MPIAVEGQRKTRAINRQQREGSTAADQGPLAHLIRLALQARVVVDSDAVTELKGGLHSALGLLYEMPGLMGKVDVASPGVSVGIELGRLVRVVVHALIIHGHAGEGFDAAFEPIGEASVVGQDGLGPWHGTGAG